MLKQDKHKFGSSTYYCHFYGILVWMREVTEYKKRVVSCQTSCVRKITQLKTDVLHCCSLHMCTHILISKRRKKNPSCLRLHTCNKEEDIWKDCLLVVLCLCWKQVLCGHSCCPNACCSVGTRWLLVEVKVQPRNKPPIRGKAERSM